MAAGLVLGPVVFGALAPGLHAQVFVPPSPTGLVAPGVLAMQSTDFQTRRSEMTVLDKLVAAVTPSESDQARAEARAKAGILAAPGDWLCMVLDHHRDLEAAFAVVKAASSESTRVAAQRRLAILLTGHAIAEEAVLYPALAQLGEKRHAERAYDEQASVKMEMARLEKLASMSADYEERLEHIRAAVVHHMFEEEGTWFLELKNRAPAAEQGRLGARYKQEFWRYVHGAESDSTFESRLADGV